MYSYIKGILTHSNRIIASKKKEIGILILYQKILYNQHQCQILSINHNSSNRYFIKKLCTKTKERSFVNIKQYIVLYESVF